MHGREERKADWLFWLSHSVTVLKNWYCAPISPYPGQALLGMRSYETGPASPFGPRVVMYVTSHRPSELLDNLQGSSFGGIDRDEVGTRRVNALWSSVLLGSVCCCVWPLRFDPLTDISQRFASALVGEEPMVGVSTKQAQFH